MIDFLISDAQDIRTQNRVINAKESELKKREELEKEKKRKIEAIGNEKKKN